MPLSDDDIIDALISNVSIRPIVSEGRPEDRTAPNTTTTTETIPGNSFPVFLERFPSGWVPFDTLTLEPRSMSTTYIPTYSGIPNPSNLNREVLPINPTISGFNGSYYTHTNNPSFDRVFDQFDKIGPAMSGHINLTFTIKEEQQLPSPIATCNICHEVLNTIPVFRIGTAERNPEAKSSQFLYTNKVVYICGKCVGSIKTKIFSLLGIEEDFPNNQTKPTKEYTKEDILIDIIKEAEERKEK